MREGSRVWVWLSGLHRLDGPATVYEVLVPHRVVGSGIVVDDSPTIGTLIPMMATTTTAEPRVIVDGLVFHWRDGDRLPFCGAVPIVGALLPASQAPDQGLAECPDCDRSLRVTGWRR